MVTDTMPDYEYADDGLYSYDRDKTIDGITELLQSDPDTHGFVQRARVKDSYATENIKYIRRHSDIVAVTEYNHGTRNPYTTVYQLAAKPAHKHEREKLLRRVLNDSPYNKLRTRVPVDVSQNDFWKDQGRLLDTESGKRRQLNVFEVEGDESTEDSKSILNYTQ